MRTINILLLALLAAIPAQAQDFRTDINPALRYYEGFILNGEIPQADRDYLFTNEWRGQELPPRFGELISGFDHQFKLARQAAQATVPCDWGIDLSPGPATLLPHLARCKQLAITAQLRVLWDLQNGKESDARDDLLATFALARNCSHDGTLIGVLVGFADQALVMASVTGNFGRFSTQTLEQLDEGFRTAPVPLTIADAFANEKKMCFTGWLERNIAAWQKENGGDDAKVLAKVREIIMPEENGTNAWDKIIKEGGTSDAILKMLRDQEGLYDKTVALLSLPYPEFIGQTNRFVAEVEAMKAANPLAALTFPDPIKAEKKEFRSQAWLAMFHAAVAYKSRGLPGLNSVNDPFGQGPFRFERFSLEGVDRGFKLTSAYTGSGFPEALIFVEVEGKPFRCDGPSIGTALSK